MTYPRSRLQPAYHRTQGERIMIATLVLVGFITAVVLASW